MSARSAAPARAGAVLGLVALLVTSPPPAPAQQVPARPVVQTALLKLGEAPAIVRHVGAKRARGRTEIRVAGVGLRSYRLSEPFRTRDRWRLYLTVDDARLALFVPRTPLAAGHVSRITNEQRKQAVRVVIEMRELGGYGLRAAHDTLVIWLGEASPARR